MPVTGKIQIEGGLFQNFEGAPLALGYLIVQLSHDEQESVDPGLVTGMPKLKIALDSNGNIPVSPATMIWPNDQLLPGNSFYTVLGYAADGTQVFGPQFWNLTSAVSPYNVANQQPTNPPGGGSGGGGGSLILETNGTQNTNQALLNIAQGTNITVTNSAGTTTISATGGAAASFMFGPGNFSVAGINPTASGAFTETALKVYFAKFQTPFSCNFSKLDIVGGSNLVGGTDFVVGVYDSTASTLLWTLGSQHIINSTATNLSYSLSPNLILTPGTYYMAWTGSDNGNGIIYGWDVSTFTYTSGTSNEKIVNQNAITYGFAANAAASGPVLPATLGALSGNTAANTSLPAFFFQV